VSSADKSWRTSRAVIDFLNEFGETHPGRIIRFDDAPTQRVRSLLTDAPKSVTEQRSDDGPEMLSILETAESLDASVGGYASSEERDDVVFFLDSLRFTGPSTLSANLGEPDEVTVLADGRTHIWWD
jgi:hypothetical protein